MQRIQGDDGPTQIAFACQLPPPRPALAVLAWTASHVRPPKIGWFQRLNGSISVLDSLSLQRPLDAQQRRPDTLRQVRPVTRRQHAWQFFRRDFHHSEDDILRCV